jgi:glutamate-5-semialdehyde dehydrogenase
MTSETESLQDAMDAREIATRAREVAPDMAAAATASKNAALRAMADKLRRRGAEVVAANATDMQQAAAAGLAESVVNRLKFGEAKLASRITSLGKIADLPDPVGTTFATVRMANGMTAERVRVPLGVILMIYEARPHVSVNAGAFCLKSGNACILRGGSEARNCNRLLGELWTESLVEAGLPAEGVQLISGSHETIGELLQLRNHIDLVIPRGGAGLIRAVEERSSIPVIKHFAGVCHVYVDGDADPEAAAGIAVDSKCLMPEVCNAAETVLVAESNVPALKAVVGKLERCGVTIKGCDKTRRHFPDMEPATEEDWTTEYLDLVVSLRLVDGVGQAAKHINKYGSHHTDAIVTASAEAAKTFREQVDSAVVVLNGSTMFCDGDSLGMGAEIGISTDRLHARGPMGLEELTTYKFVITGCGQTMSNPEELCTK